MSQIQDNSVSHQSVDIQKATDKVFAFLKKNKTGQTLPDIQMATGLSAFKTEDALGLLMQQYECTLDVNEKGQLVYNFDFKKPRNPQPWKKIAAQIADFTVHLLLFVAKLVITVVFFSYALTAGVVIAVLITALAKSVQPILFLFVALFEAAKLLFVDIQSFFGKKKKPAAELNSKNIINSVFVYAFGYKPFVDEMEQEKKILAYIRSVNYKITLTDLALITGWDSQKCNRELTFMLTHYNGNVSVTDEGVIVYHFPEFQTDKSFEPSSPEQFYVWNNQPDDKIFDYRKRTDFKVIKGVSIFSLIVSVISLWINKASYNLQAIDFWDILTLRSQQRLGMASDTALWAEISLYLFVFFVMFFVFAAIAKAKEKKLTNKIVLQQNWNTALKNLIAYLPDVPRGLFDSFNEQRMFDFSFAYRAELLIDEQDASLFYRFKIMADEMLVAERERGIGFGQFVREKTMNELKTKSQAKQTTKKIVYKKGKSVPMGKQIFRWSVVVAMVAVAFYFQSIFAVFQMQFTSAYDKNASLTVDHSSLLFPLFQTDSYQNFGKLVIKNASKKRPVPEFDSVSNFIELTIDGANQLILPRRMDKLERLTLKNITGSMVYPVHFKRIQHIHLENIKWDVNLIHTNLSYLYTFTAKHVKGALNVKLHSSSMENLTVVNCALNDNTVDSLRFFSGMETINLSENNLTKIPNWVTYSSQLQGLILRENKISSLPANLSAFERLYDLNLAHNDIKKLPDSLNLSVLTEVNLSANQISQLPKSFWAYKVGSILLDSNQISGWPVPDAKTKISKISVANNQFSDFPTNRYLLTDLRDLNVAYNQIKRIDDSITSFKIYYLDLTANQITTLTSDIFTTSLKTLKVAHNPLDTVVFVHKPYYAVDVYIDEAQKKNVLLEFKKWVGVENLHYVGKAKN